MKSTQKNKLYLKAMKLYEEGYIDKSIEKCEEAVSENLKNAAALNLKGLLLYLKGDIESAVATWKVNSDFNDDNIAKNYIKDSEADRERLSLYIKGEELIKRLEIEEALNVLLKCKESDFNSINVNLALALCYMRKGDYSLSGVYITKVLEIDKNNNKARAIVKELEKYTGMKILAAKEGRNIKYIIGLVAIIVFCSITVLIYQLVSKNEDTEKVDNLDKHQIENIQGNMNEVEEKDNTKEEISIEEVNKAIEDKNYDYLHDIIQSVKSERLNGKGKTVYLKAEWILKEEGTENFYKKAMSLYESKKLNEAKVEFNKAYLYGKDNYLYPHILFFNGAVSEILNDNKNAIIFYENYYNGYKEESYTEEILYKLAVLYKDEDIDKSVEYARTLKSTYPRSMYNNNVISKILEQYK